jgi:hypothetical protein
MAVREAAVCGIDLPAYAALVVRGQARARRISSTAVSQLLMFAALLLLGSGCAVQSPWEALILNDTVRVQALSPILVRIELVGPIGFEDRTTFMITNRSSPGIPLHVVGETEDGVKLITANYTVIVRRPAGKNNSKCADARNNFQAEDWVGLDSSTSPQPNKTSSANECQSMCLGDKRCAGWVYQVRGCFLLSGWSGLSVANGTTFGTCNHGSISFAVKSADESTTFLDQLEPPAKDTPGSGNLLLWPSPLQSLAYAITDWPRFHTPEWGPIPMNSTSRSQCDPAVIGTNGFDFRNNNEGDWYVFLLGTDLSGWHAARMQYNQLAGSTPLLPSWAFGTWFTYWHQYTEEEATSDVERWDTDKLPLDVYGLDMNWRNITNGQDHFYDHPNTTLFPNFTNWFEYLEKKQLKSYFNDHPFQMAPQLSAEEVSGLQV